MREETGFRRVLAYSTTPQLFRLYINNEFQGKFTFKELLHQPNYIVKHAIQLIRPHNPLPVAVRIGDEHCVIEPS